MGSKVYTMPYIESILEKLRQGDPDFIQAFGRHVHWGYWENSAPAGGVADYGAAAERLTRRVCDAARITDSMRVLDVGCGVGGTLASLNGRCANLTIMGLNIDGRQLEWARQHVIPRGRNVVGFIGGDACRLPFADGSFDVVLAVECIYHFPSRTAFLKEAHRVLRPGGRLTFSDFVPRGAALPVLALLASFFYGSFVRHLGSLRLPCTLSQYRTLARRAGFSALECDDITLHTLPTYAEQRRLQNRMDTCSTDAARATTLTQWISRAGLLRYLILSCDRRGSG